MKALNLPANKQAENHYKMNDSGQINISKVEKIEMPQESIKN